MADHGSVESAGVVRILNCIPSEGTENDWGFRHADQAGLLASAGAIPDSKDLRETWWTIGDQRATGSCVGWASADSLLRWHFVKSGKLTTSQLLSPRFMWMAAKDVPRGVEERGNQPAGHHGE